MTTRTLVVCVVLAPSSSRGSYVVVVCESRYDFKSGDEIDPSAAITNAATTTKRIVADEGESV